MSWKATAWAREQSTGDPTRKLLLLLLADHTAAPDLQATPPRADWRAWVSVPTLARLAECCERTARAHLRELEAAGLVVTVRRPGRTSHYVLPVGADPLPQPVDNPSTTPADIAGVGGGPLQDLPGTPATRCRGPRQPVAAEPVVTEGEPGEVGSPAPVDNAQAVRELKASLRSAGAQAVTR